MTTDLANLLTAYTPSEFDFHATRMNPQDKLDFEAGHRATVKKILDREDLAITRDLLESKRGGQDLTPQQLLATTRVISALYMKNYAIRRGLATCTGIPSFPYREVTECFPTFDYPLLRRTIVALGGEEFLVRRPLEEIIAGYSSQQHKLFSYHLEAFLEASACYLKTKSNHPDSLSSMRALFEQFFFKLAERTRSVPISLVDFYAEGSAILATVGTEIANKNAVFAGEWRKYMPEASMGLVAITTATDSEDKALFAELKAQGFTKVRTIRAGENFVQEYSRGVGQRIVHLRTGAGSLGVLSAGSILPDVLRELSPDYLISAGICFGLKPLKDGEPFQKLGDVVCATSIHDYETVRQGNEVELRGNLLPVGPNILQATRIARSQLGKVKYRFFEGQVVSGQKLVDSEEFVESLRARFPAALAGEMEGNAVASTSIYKGWQWILIKGICDWGMNKDDSWQAVAAERACRLAVATAMVLLTTPRT
jgi:nucleoside phosphorylase